MSDLSGLFTTTEQKYNLPPGILAATAKVESHLNPAAVSPKGAQGLMQLMPTTAKSLGADPFDVPSAVDAAGRLWAQNLKAAGGDIDKAAMMYNAGPDPQRWNNPETRAYPQKLAAALGPAQQPQPGGGDPIEAALEGHAPAPQQSTSSAPVDKSDPIEAALSGQGQPDPATVNAQMRSMYEKGAKTADIVAYGTQHGVTPNADQIEAARKQGFGTVNFAPPVSPDQAGQPQPQTDQGLGFYEGIMRPLDNGTAWANALLDKVGLLKPVENFNHAMGWQTGDETAAQHQAYVQQQEAQGKTPGGLGEFAGEVLGTVPVALATKNPFVAGAASGALTTPNPKDGKQILLDALLGGAGGAAAHGVTSAISGLVAPEVSKMAQALNNLGVDLTPGTILGGAAKHAEDWAAGVPILKEIVNSAQRRSATSLNTAVINDRVLGPIGKALPKGMVGREAVAHADDQVGNAYEELLPKLTLHGDGQLATGLQSALDVVHELPPERANQVLTIMKNSIGPKFDRPGWTMTGEGFKEADAKLGQLAREYAGSSDPEQRKMGSIFRNVQTEMRSALERSNPAYAPTLSKINQAFANLIRVEGAASSQGAKGGVWTANQLASAVRRFDPSPRKKAYATGKALLQDVSDPASEIMPSTIPDSGTGYRTIAAYLLGGGASHLSPWLAPVAAPLPLYTRAGQKAFQKVMLAPRTPAEKALANALAKLKTPSAIAGGAASAEAVNGN